MPVPVPSSRRTDSFHTFNLSAPPPIFFKVFTLEKEPLALGRRPSAGNECRGCAERGGTPNSPKEVLQLCRGGGRSLTAPGVWCFDVTDASERHDIATLRL
jgi:hypothetical protein